MKRKHVPAGSLLAVLLLAVGPGLHGQTSSAPTSDSSNPAEETVVLSPFVVEAGEDADSYRATATLAGTRIRTNLEDVGSAIQVVTGKFLQDTSSKNAADLLVYTTSTEVAAQGGNFVGGGDGAVIDTTSYTQPVANTRVRGLAEADNLRDFFLTDIPWDSYNVGRVDLQRGANSVLFGIGSPAGIINSSINGASLRNEGEIEVQLGSFGTHRETIDYNHVLIDDTLAVRVAVLNDRTKYKQRPAFRDDERFFVAGRWDPKLITDGSTSIRASFEKGEVNANYSRLTPPMDSITPWFSAMGRETFAYQDSNSLTTFGNEDYNPWLGAAGNRIWDGLASSFEPISDEQSRIWVAQPANFPAFGDGTTFPTGTNNTVNGSYKGIQSYSSFASNSRLPGYVIQPFKARSLTDDSIFDFYNNLIEGDNKRNWNEFEAFNVSVGQTFMKDRFGIELTYDDQDSSWSYRNAIAGDAAAISVDVMETFADGSPNPGLGRAMVIFGGGSAGSGWTNRTRETVRATGFGKFDFAEVMERESMLARILGNHHFTLAYTDYTDETYSKNWVNWYVGEGYAPVANIAVGQAGRDITPVVYLSGDLRGTSSAQGLDLQRVRSNIVAQGGVVQQWNTQQAAFVGYGVPVVTPDEETGPFTNASLQKNVIDSKIAVWQAHLFDGIVVPMVGWRKDEAISFNAGTPTKTLGLVDNVNDPDWRLPRDSDDTDNGRSWDRVEGDTQTYSVVVKVPRSIMDRVPGRAGLSFFYNKSENFRPDASRRDILGAPIPAPSGETEDYGVTLSLFDSNLILKVNRYETSVTNATLSNALGNSYLIGAGEAWGQAAAYQLSINSGNWPGDGNFGTTSAASAFGAGNVLRWQPSDNFLVADSMGRAPGSTGYVQTYSQAAIDAQYDIQRRSTDDWMANPVPQAFQQAWGMTGYATGSGSWSQNNVAVTGDTLSKGTEFELIATDVGVRGLNLAVNASRTDARRLNLAQAYATWIEQRWEDYQGPMGDMRLWGNGNWALQEGAGGTVRDKFNNEVMPNYMLALALNGSKVPELRPWRFNVIANYAFSEGRFDGANVGASYRWQDKQVVGYRLNSALDGYEVENPYFGPSEDAVDLWVGYERQLTDRLKWRVQFNVRNLFASKDLVPVTVQPDGSPGAFRIPEPRTLTLTNSISF